MIFSEPVTGVDSGAPFGDFALITSGVSGAAITGVSGSGTTYTVTVNTGSGNGTIRLDVKDDNSIIDSGGNPLGGVNVGDGDFNSGEVYMVIKTGFAIMGNAGVGGASMQYADGTPKTVIADVSGNYTIILPYGWSGTVTPYKSGYQFTPVSRTYSNLQSNQTNQDYTSQACPSCADINVNIGGSSIGSYTLASGEEKRETYPVSGGPVKVESTNAMDIVTAIRLQSYANNTLYSFVETMGVPAGSLSSKYYFPTYNNTWGPLNSQLRFGNLNNTPIKVKVTIGTDTWTYDVPANAERREYLAVSGGPVIIESVDANGVPTPDKKIVAAIRLQSYADNTLYSFSETMGIPAEKLSSKYYFPTYNNTWGPLNSQLRFGNLNNTQIKVKVTIGTDTWTYDVPANAERREYLAVSGGPVIVESVDANGDPTPDQKIIAAIRLQSYVSSQLYSFVETMGVPAGSLSSKYYFPTYNNTWGPLNSQLRFGNLNDTAIKVRVTIGSASWTYDVPANSERREYLAVSGGR